MKDQYTLISVGQANLKLLSCLAELVSAAHFQVLRASLASLAAEQEVLGKQIGKSQSSAGQLGLGQWQAVMPKELIESQTQIAQSFATSVLEVQKMLGADGRGAFSEWQTEVVRIFGSFDQSQLLNELNNRYFGPFASLFTVSKK